MLTSSPKSSKNIFAVPMAKLSHLLTTSLGIVRTAWSQKTLLTQFILQKKTSSPYHRQASFGVSYASSSCCLTIWSITFVCFLSMPSSHVTTMWPSSCSLGMPVWERLYLGINRSTRLKLLLCWLHFVQPIRSVFLSTSSLIAFWYDKKPGVSEQVVLCHVLFDPGLWKHVSFLSPHSMWHFIPSHGKNLSWSPLGQHSAILWRQLSSLADTDANSIAHREFQHVKAYCRPWFLSMLLNGLIRHWHARCKSFRLLNKIWQLHRLHRRSHSTCLSSIRSISHDFFWYGALCRDSCSKLHDLQTQVTAAASKNTHTTQVCNEFALGNHAVHPGVNAHSAPKLDGGSATKTGKLSPVLFFIYL